MTTSHALHTVGTGLTDRPSETESVSEVYGLKTMEITYSILTEVGGFFSGEKSQVWGFHRILKLRPRVVH